MVFSKGIRALVGDTDDGAPVLVGWWVGAAVGTRDGLLVGPDIGDLVG